MEKSVIVEAANGDVRAFKKLFDFYMPRMRNTSLRYANSGSEADDILQEAFIKVFHNLKTFKFDGSLEGWIRRIVINTALNHYNSNKALYLFEQLENIDEADLDGNESDEIEFIEDTEPSEIQKCIDKLPEGYKLVFNLYVVEDLSHKEIAVMLGISEGTSRSQYSKGKKMLKKMLSRQRIC